MLVDGTAMEAVREGDFFVFDQIGSGTHTFQVPAGAKMTLTVNGTCFACSSRQLSVSVTNEDGTAVDLNGVPIV